MSKNFDSKNDDSKNFQAEFAKSGFAESLKSHQAQSENSVIPDAGFKGIISGLKKKK